MRKYSIADKVILGLQQFLHSTLPTSNPSARPNPSTLIEQDDLSFEHRGLSQRLMRINHRGEVCAQALYQGQALAARDKTLRCNLLQAAQEETDHLLWCQTRIRELQGRTSYLNTLWWAGSYSIGIIAGFVGDRWSLGFLAETENQVYTHLQKHLQQLPQEDYKSRAILEQMQWDEQQHAISAIKQGAYDLPQPIVWMMSSTARIMTTLTYYA
ncbi:MAG TPA: 2-polyprenyl-3-methyl-6-methoxy-1,4-benzoquinone monooxygenase [Gammaproteobacteria bacterium]|nr:2-polyprenyl-3-methyl-6-methoxy-1,4-benzoquinone monooxygenase [Gammaproteobacteria bacterium]